MVNKLNKQVSLGISGAPGVGKTSVVDEVAKQVSSKHSVELSKDVARSLARQGVRINTESGIDDYLAFLTVRFRDMSQLHADVVIYDRTLLDILVFMELNEDDQGWLKQLTEELLRWQMDRLSLYFYIPMEFEIEHDGVRIADPIINHQIDQIIVRLLREHRPDFITLRGSISERVNTIFESLSQVGIYLKV